MTHTPYIVIYIQYTGIQYVLLPKSTNTQLQKILKKILLHKQSNNRLISVYNCTGYLNVLLNQAIKFSLKFSVIAYLYTVNLLLGNNT